MRCRIFTAIAFCIMLVLTACTYAPPETRMSAQTLPSEKADDATVIGVSVLDLTNPYYSEVVRGMTDEAARRRVQIDIRDPQSDAYRQINDVELFIENKVDAIVIAALSPEELEPVLLRARQQGIIVVAWATEITNCSSQLALDEWDMGYKLGLEAGKWLSTLPPEQQKIAILEYSRIPQIKNRVKGMLDGLRESTTDAQVVAQRSASNPEEGYRSSVDILKSYPEVRMILAINDGGALGALQAVEEANISANQFYIGGCDATPEAIAKINRNTAYKCTVDIYPYYTGEVCIEFTVRILNGENVPVRYTFPTKTIAASE